LLQGHRGSVAGLAMDVVEELAGYKGSVESVVVLSRPSRHPRLSEAVV
jgi:hypothetical protein